MFHTPWIFPSWNLKPFWNYKYPNMNCPILERHPLPPTDPGGKSGWIKCRSPSRRLGPSSPRRTFNTCWRLQIIQRTRSGRTWRLFYLKTCYRGHQLFRGQVQVEQVSVPQVDVQYLLVPIIQRTRSGRTWRLYQLKKTGRTCYRGPLTILRTSSGRTGKSTPGGRPVPAGGYKLFRGQDQKGNVGWTN